MHIVEYTFCQFLSALLQLLSITVSTLGRFFLCIDVNSRRDHHHHNTRYVS